MNKAEGRGNDIERIRELETELLKLRLNARHFDFANDYDRRSYIQKSLLDQDDLEHMIVEFMKHLDEPIENKELIHRLVTEIPNLTEYDLEKTNSGNIRIFSAIRTAVVRLQDKGVIAKSKKYEVKRGHLILVDKYKQWKERSTGIELFQPRLCDNFPTNKEEAKLFGVIMYDEITVFKVFEIDESLNGKQLLGEVLERINAFLTKNGYSEIPINDLEMEDGPNYQSPEGLFSLSKHGYCDDLVVFIKKYNY
jgi:hypothetical protein